MLEHLENITENMNIAGYEGKWFSYIHNMDMYRIRLLDDEFKIWLANDSGQSITDTLDAKNILRLLRR